jgi:hypothetical protein
MIIVISNISTDSTRPEDEKSNEVNLHSEYSTLA